MAAAICAAVIVSAGPAMAAIIEYDANIPAPNHTPTPQDARWVEDGGGGCFGFHGAGTDPCGASFPNLENAFHLNSHEDRNVEDSFMATNVFGSLAATGWTVTSRMMFDKAVYGDPALRLHIEDGDRNASLFWMADGAVSPLEPGLYILNSAGDNFVRIGDLDTDPPISGARYHDYEIVSKGGTVNYFLDGGLVATVNRGDLCHATPMTRANKFGRLLTSDRHENPLHRHRRADAFPPGLLRLSPPHVACD